MQPHFKVPIAALCLFLGPNVSYVHDFKTILPQNEENSVGSRRIMAPAGVLVYDWMCLWYFNVLDKKLVKEYQPIIMFYFFFLFFFFYTRWIEDLITMRSMASALSAKLCKQNLILGHVKFIRQKDLLRRRNETEPVPVLSSPGGHLQ